MGDVVKFPRKKLVRPSGDWALYSDAAPGIPPIWVPAKERDDPDPIRLRHLIWPDKPEPSGAA
jgi:hypothetical protein